jgi:hypothetical protein
MQAFVPNRPAIDCSTLGPIFGPLLAAAPLNELGAGHADSEIAKTLRAISIAEAFAPHRIIDQDMADACLAGLWLMYDHLDKSHTISQSIDTPAGSYWHGIMHRREGDFDNAKYWFRRVGTHPIFAPLAATARELAREHISDATEADRAAAWMPKTTDWEPFRFVDLCAAALQGHSAAGQLCRWVQQQECRLLFDFCFRHAIRLS